MKWLLKLVGGVTGNPMLLVWLAVGSFAAGGVTTGTVVWKYKEAQVVAVQAKFDSFVAQTKTLGKAAARDAATQKKNDERRQEQANNENEKRLTALRADIKRMRDANSSRDFLPPVRPGSVSAKEACLDRAELEQALRRFTDRASGLVGRGDEAIVDLDTAKTWAQQRPEK